MVTHLVPVWKKEKKMMIVFAELIENDPRTIEDDLGTMNIPRSRSRRDILSVLLLGLQCLSPWQVTHDKKIFGHEEYFNPSRTIIVGLTKRYSKAKTKPRQNFMHPWSKDIDNILDSIGNLSETAGIIFHKVFL